MNRYIEKALNPEPENIAAMLEQDERPLSREETIKALEGGAIIVIGKNPPFVRAAEKLLKIYGDSSSIPLEACEEVIEKGKFSHQPEMLVAVARKLESAN
ncbi:MAG: hypothetical protein AAB488_00315 [Patescibacteria group bacterium]